MATEEQPIDRLLPRLLNVKPSGTNSYRCCCPAHDDAHPSLHVRVLSEGTVLLQCRSQQCTSQAIVAAVGLTLRDLFPAETNRGNGRIAPSKPKRKHATLDAVVRSLLRSSELRGGVVTRYEYADSFFVLRFDMSDGSKSFRPVHRVADKWAVGDPDGKLPLYRIHEAADHDTVYVFEGEKCVEAARSIGLCATTSAHGSQSPQRTDWGPLANRNVVILPDNDAPGAKYAEQVSGILRLQHGFKRSNCTVKIVTLPGLGGGEDIADFIKARGSVEPDQIRETIEQIAGDTPEWKPGPSTALRQTEMGLAEHFVRAHKDDFRFAKGMSYLAFDGTRWRPDDTGEVICRLKDHTLNQYHEAAKIKNDKDRNELLAFIYRAERRSFMESVLWHAAVDPLWRIRAEDLDRHPWLFNVLNGTVDLRTGKLRPHRRADLITKLSPIAYDPAAGCKQFKKFLAEIMCGNEQLIAWLQCFLGMCLTGIITEQIFVIFHGLGMNGKSVLIDLVKFIMGDYAADAPPDLLITRSHREHPTEIADLHGRRLVVCNETEEGNRLRLQLMKRMTGDSTLKGRRMCRDFFEFQRTFKLILITNNRPTIRENTMATWRRVRLILFDFTPKVANRDLTAELQEEAPGILRWMVEGCLAWVANGLPKTPAIEAATKSYKDDQDMLSSFLDECCCTEHTGAKVSRAAVWKAYSEWAVRNKELFPLPRKALFERLRVQGYDDAKYEEHGKTIRGFAGIGLSEEDHGL